MFPLKYPANPSRYIQRNDEEMTDLKATGANRSRLMVLEMAKKHEHELFNTRGKGFEAPKLESPQVIQVLRYARIPLHHIVICWALCCERNKKAAAHGITCSPALRFCTSVAVVLLISCRDVPFGVVAFHNFAHRDWDGELKDLSKIETAFYLNV